MPTHEDYKGIAPTWCPGCGNFGILEAVKKALTDLKIEPYQAVMVSGIGQAGKLPHYARANILNVLHGRTLPCAIGVKLANPESVVMALGGDGDGYAEGGNHFVHSAHRNHDITYLVHNNQVYGLTKGQASPTSDEGFVTKTTPHGAPPGLNPIALAIVAGASFVARGFAGDRDHLAGLIQKAVRHKGFSIIDILQPCVSFNHKNTYQWYKERVYKIEDIDTYDSGNQIESLLKALEWGDRIPIGVIFEAQRETFEDRIPVLKGETLVKQPLKPRGMTRLLKEFL